MSNIIRRSKASLSRAQDNVARNAYGEALVSEERVKRKNMDMVLADYSGSMSGVACEGKSKIDCLRMAMTPLVGRVLVLAFSDDVIEVDADAIPDPYAGTNLLKALRACESYEPMHVLVISDGAPYPKDECLPEAARLSENFIIDVLYVGRASDTDCIEFMRSLAKAGRGRYQAFDLERQAPALLESTVAKLLSLPAPKVLLS